MSSEAEVPWSLQALLHKMRENTRYFLKPDSDRAIWQEVTQEEFVAAERGAGFYPKHGCGPVATSSFSAGGQRGTSVALEEHLPHLGRYIDLDGELHESG